MNAFRHFLQRFNRKENAVNPEDQVPVEETQDDAADSPPAEETVVEEPQEAPVEASPAQDVALAPIVPAAPSLDQMIADGATAIQEGITGRRDNLTAIHDTKLALASAQSQADQAVKRDAEWDTWLGARIDEQVTNLQALKATLDL